MKTMLNAEQLIWSWNNDFVTLGSMDNKKLKMVKFVIEHRCKHEFFNGVHRTGYLEAISQILRVRKSPLTTIPTNSEEEEAYIRADRFLGELSEGFPNSNLSRQINNSINYNQLTTQKTI